MKSRYIFLLIILLAVPLILPLLKSGFLITDDADWFLIRFTAFHQDLVAGQFPVRLLSRLNHQYGYPVANFNYPGYMYLAEIPKILGFGFINSFKAVLIASVLSSAIFTYLWLKKKFDESSALIGSLFYIYSPYYIFDIYKRGSIGEVLALAVVPFVLFAISRKKRLLTGIGYAMLILSHNILALIFLPILLVYQLLTQIEKYKHPLHITLYSLLLGLGLSSFFWLPALYELRFTVFNQVVVSDFNEYLIGVSRIYLFGWIHILILGAYIATKRKANFFLVIVIIAGLLSLSASAIFWKVFPLERFIQFPFRLLSIWVVGISYVSADFFATRFNKKFHIIAAIITFGLILQSWSMLSKNKHIERNDGYYATNESTSTIHDEYMPIWVKDKPMQRPDQPIEIISSTKLQINKIYWPGLTVYVDGAEVPIYFDNPRGVMQIDLPEEQSAVEVKFKETPLRKIANALSLGSITFMLLKLFIWRKHL
jgi:hypothetical protein